MKKTVVNCLTGEVSEEEFTQEDLESLPSEKYLEELKRKQLEIERSSERDASMLLGDTYVLDGVSYQVSLTKDDGDGMIQVKIGFELGVQKTIVHFSNGTKVPVNSSNFPEFALWFVNARNKFFI